LLSQVEVLHGFIEFFDCVFYFSIAVKLTGEFTSMEEPIDDSDITAVTVFPAGGHDFVGSKRRIEPREPTQNLRLPIVRSIS
jgi:hypothetical protein